MKYTALFSNHKVNYYEAINRLKYWSERLSSNPIQARVAIRLLADLLATRSLEFNPEWKAEQPIESRREEVEANL